MFKELEQLKKEAAQDLATAHKPEDMEAIRIKYLGKKSVLMGLMKQLGTLSNEDKPKAGQLLNDFKVWLQEEMLAKGAPKKRRESSLFDVTLPGPRVHVGHQHPITTMMQTCVSIFRTMGFDVKTGPDIETDFYNFEALNIPADHPARDMHDTFYISGNTLLRTHTSPVQIHVMENEQPPFRFIAPGKVYRRDSDVTHLPMFHQIEGLVVDRHVSFADLKGVLSVFLQSVFGSDTAVRFRPSYFPFTEPSAEIDISCTTCKGKGCRVCSQTGWLEIAGAGMVDPEVFKAVNVNSKEWMGFAFGLGVERIAMLKYGIDDIRLFYENDVRFLKQF